MTRYWPLNGATLSINSTRIPQGELTQLATVQCNKCGSLGDADEVATGMGGSIVYVQFSVKPPCDHWLEIPSESEVIEVKRKLHGTDPVNHPGHYTEHPSGVECIAITEHMNFCLGNAVKYIWRAGLKADSPIEDLRKARWYLDREITRISGAE